MAKIYELVSQKSVEAVRPFIVDAIEAIGLEGLDRGRKDENIYLFTKHSFFTESTAGEAGPLLIAAVHSVMMQHAKFDEKAPSPFTHRVDQPWSYVTHVLDHLAPGVVSKRKTGAASPMGRLAGDVLRLLRYNKVVYQIGGSSSLWIRPWPENLERASYAPPRETRLGGERATKPKSSKPDFVTEKRIAEEANKPVVTKFTVPALPTEPDPKAILDWAKRFKATFDKMTEKYHQAMLENAELQAKVEALEKLTTTGEWKETLTGLHKVLEDNGKAE